MLHQRATTTVVVAGLTLALTALAPGAEAAGVRSPGVPPTLSFAPLGASHASDRPVTQLIVKYRPGAKRGASESVPGASSVPGRSLLPGQPIAAGTTTVRLDRPLSRAAAEQAAHELETDPRVLYAEPDLWFAADSSPAVAPASVSAPNDQYLSQQWPLIGDFGIRVRPVWPTWRGAGVVVAVLDTGITAHPDLTGQTVAGADMIVDTAVSNDGNGRDANPADPGDWYTDGTGLHPSSWHGTHVSGTIAAHTDNSIGVAGVAPLAKIEPVRVLGTGGGYLSDIEAGIYWAAGFPVSGVAANANPAKVINMSLGASIDPCPVSTQDAIDAAVGAGVTVVVAAGNSKQPASGFTPANCNNVVTVSATGPAGYTTYYSNYGAAVDLAAPGGEMSSVGDPNGVLSTLNDGTTTPGNPIYAYDQGTSMATPHVAGSVALLLEEEPGLTPAQVEQRLKAKARVLPQCTVSDCGAGLLDVTALIGNPPAAPSGVAVSRLDSALKPNWQAASNGGLIVTGYSASAYDSLTAGSVVGTCTTSALTCTISGLVNGTSYYIEVTATNALGAGPPSSPRVAGQPRVSPVSRLSGPDRYATSAAISAASFAPGVPKVYVATGTSFPDALSGAPVAAKDGAPVLLVTPTSIPAPIATELTRLSPGQIVILGGTGAVSDAVQTELQGYTAAPVTRLAGADRYATSAAMSAASFTPGVGTAFIATGLSFPDALSGAPVAGKLLGPVLLVQPNAIPASIAAELTRLAPANIVVLGGTGAVFDAVKDELQGYTAAPVTRLAGSDRYATSAAISAASFDPGVAVVYIATGTSFPDALSGAPVAGAAASPVLLVTPTAIPNAVKTELTRLAPARVVVLGGTGAVSDAVATALADHVP